MLRDLRLIMKHCWHAKWIMRVTGERPIHSDYCCYCDTRRSYVVDAGISDGLPHGPFFDVPTGEHIEDRLLPVPGGRREPFVPPRQLEECPARGGRDDHTT
jgi:hypothetical protein